MPRTIDYYFSLVEPLGLYRPPPVHGRSPRGSGLAVNYKPVFLGRVFARDRRAAAAAAPSGAAALSARRPAALARAGAAWRFNLQPKFWPFDVNLADRFVVAIVMRRTRIRTPSCAAPWPASGRRSATSATRSSSPSSPRRRASTSTSLLEAAQRHADRGGLCAQPRERGRGRRFRLAGLCARRRGVLGPGPARAPRRRADERAGAVSAGGVNVRGQWSVVSRREAFNDG